MAVATKRETITISEAEKRYGIRRHLVYQLIEMEFFRPILNNPKTPSGRSRYQLFTDELDRYIELRNSGMPDNRLLAAMKQFRSETRKAK